MTEALRLADRVFQLESQNLDHQFDKIIGQGVDGLNIPAPEEIKLLIKLYLFANLIKDYTTIGMKSYRSIFYDSGSNDEQQLNLLPKSYKLIILASCNLIMPYLSKKNADLQSVLGLRNLKFPWLTLENVSMIVRSLNIMNFLIFLRHGKYPSIQERLLGLVRGASDQDYNHNISMNKVQMELMNRDQMWKGLAEFLVAVVPYINTERIRNQVFRITGLMPKVSSELKLSEKISRKEHAGKCAICRKQPFNPYIIGCRHVFCYYCLHSRYLSDPSNGFVCLLCKFNTRDPLQVQRFRVYEFMKQT